MNHVLPEILGVCGSNSDGDRKRRRRGRGNGENGLDVLYMMDREVRGTLRGDEGWSAANWGRGGVGMELFDEMSRYGGS